MPIPEKRRIISRAASGARGLNDLCAGAGSSSGRKALPRKDGSARPKRINLDVLMRSAGNGPAVSEPRERNINSEIGLPLKPGCWVKLQG